MPSENRIFPLLQEYFFDDWSKIRAVLGANMSLSASKTLRDLLPAVLEQADEDREDLRAAACERR